MKAVPLSRYFVFLGIAATGCAADLATKRWIFAVLGHDHPAADIWWLWPNVFGFQTSLNPGALFGLGAGWVWAFAALSMLALAGILYWLFFGRASGELLLTVALGCITAGILGNLYDRLGLHGLCDRYGHPIHAVRDWILVMIFGYHWPNFNVADSLLVCGAALLLWHAMRSDLTGETVVKG